MGRAFRSLPEALREDLSILFAKQSTNAMTNFAPGRRGIEGLGIRFHTLGTNFSPLCKC